MSAHLVDCLLTSPVAEVFSDKAVLGAMLEFEVALAEAEADLEIIPAEAAEVIRRAAVPGAFDARAIGEVARAHATPSIPFVQALTQRVREIDAFNARFVHWGATSQDVSDTAMVLCLTRAVRVLRNDHVELVHRLVLLSDEHASTVMLGRTLLQPATPTTFGLKVAGWAEAIGRTWRLLGVACDDLRVLQLGGAAGTLASLGEAGLAVQRGVADRLGLSCPPAPWHSQRDRIANFLAAIASYVGSMAKMAGDIALLMQAEIAEAAEKGGGSSTMPHKRNPSGCAIVLAAASRTPGLAASGFNVLVQQHERGVGGWHAEAVLIRDAVVAAGAAVSAARDVIEGLSVSPDRMRANLASTKGVIFAERLTFMLAAALGREEAARLVAETVARCQASGRTFGDEVRGTATITATLSAEALADFDDPDTYLGSAELFRRQLIDDVRQGLPG